jgi:two-component system alkaline phosphatase synthesis response regulator PhoP
MNSKRRLLIVDDDPDFATAIRDILESADYETEITHNPEQGWAALKANQYDLVLLDIMMGRGAEGVMMARKIRKDQSLREMPVMAITGLRDQIAFLFPGRHIDPEFIAVDELVEKPVEPELLLERVGALIEASEARRTGGDV